MCSTEAALETNIHLMLDEINSFALVDETKLLFFLHNTTQLIVSSKHLSSYFLQLKFGATFKRNKQ